MGCAVLRRVLIVDDSNAMRAFVRAALEDGVSEVELVEAESGFEALRQLPRQPIDLAILDINMPHIHGLELIALLRRDERYRALPVLVISTESAQRDQQRALELGATAFLSKPFEAEQLVERVNALLAAPADGA
jgi:two-component system chemotaxis response regulator CheY